MHIATTAPVAPEQLQRALRLSVYAGESDAVLAAIIDYCAVLGVDPMTRPVRAVIDDTGRITIRPTLTLYRIRALATGQFAGKSEPVFTAAHDGDFEHPDTCSITMWRVLSDGSRAATTVRESWAENVWKTASGSPHPLWVKRPHGQLARIAEIQAYRAAFGDVCPGYTWEELNDSESETEQPSAAVAPVTTRANAPDFSAKPKKAPEKAPETDPPRTKRVGVCLTPAMVAGLRDRLGGRDEAAFCASLGLPDGSTLEDIPVSHLGAALAKASH